MAERRLQQRWRSSLIRPRSPVFSSSLTFLLFAAGLHSVHPLLFIPHVNLTHCSTRTVLTVRSGALQKSNTLRALR